MKNRNRAAALGSLVLMSVCSSVIAQSGMNAVFAPVAELKWVGAGVPGVSTAVVRGDMAKSASHFFLKYASGFAAPVHHHSPDHYATLVSGNLVLIVEGKEHRLAPGSYFAFTGRAQHGARCEGAQDCVMFIDARGPWDVVVAKAKGEK